jgi:hypothetical protein
MGEQDYRHGEVPNEHDLDVALDAALAKYSAVEPRAGLEERVLAHMREEQTRYAERGWWRWGFAAAVVAIFVVAVALAWRSGKTSQLVIANRPSVLAPSPKAPAVAVDASADASNKKNAVRPRERVSIHRSAHLSPHAAVMATVPKLDQFPSPQPLSEQEKILESYVEKYPEHAALVARARTEATRRDQLEEMQAFPSSDWTSDSEEPNNDKTNR